MVATSSIISLALLGVAPLVIAAPVASPQAAAAGACADVNIIAARASGEKPGAGIIGSLVIAIQGASKKKISTAVVDYPATLEKYAQSSAAGTAALTKQLTAAVKKCPSQKQVLVGYSQGAHIIGDTIAGGGGGIGLGVKTPPVDPAVSGAVTAVVLMGDPRHVAKESFQKGTATRQGLFPRGADQSLEKFAKVTQSYCDRGDLFCASGTSIATHLGYTREHNDGALQFVLARIGR